MERELIQSQIEHLQMKYVGTGHADTTKFEWAVNNQRDTFSSFIGHPNLLSYISVAENVSIGRKRFELLQRMVQPCGVPPSEEEDENK